MSNQDPDDIKFNEYKKFSDYMYEKNSDVIYKTSVPPIPKETFATKFWTALHGFLMFTFVKFPTYIGQGLVYLFENISKVINVQVGLFNAEKVEMACIIKSQKEEIAKLRSLNEELDEDNWAYGDAIDDLHRVGQQMHDEIVATCGRDAYLALRWREAESRAEAKLNINYETSNKYLNIRERRELQARTPINYPFIEALANRPQKKAAKKAAKKKTKKG